MDNHIHDALLSDCILDTDDAGSNRKPAEFCWVDCVTVGWQALIASSDISFDRPEPPKCVQSSRKTRLPINSGFISDNSAQVCMNSTVLGSKNRVASRSKSPKAKVSFTDANFPQIHTVSPRGANFIEANIRGAHSPGHRRTKTALLEQAANQLEQSEIQGNSLAERLKQMHRKINN